MFENYTSESGAKVTDNEVIWISLITTEYIVILLSLATLVCGLSSWCIIKEFRKYRNYVYLNAILANFLFYTTALCFQMYGSIILIPRMIFVLFFYYLSVKNFWLLVICHMFYMDFVKVFDGHIQNRYFKSTIFAWVMSSIVFTVLIVILYYFVKPNLHFLDTSNNIEEINVVCIFFCASSLLPLIANFCFYIIIVFSVCRSFKTSTNTTSDICRRLYLATLIFILSDVILLSGCVISVIYPEVHASDIPPLVRILTFNFNAFTLPIFFIVVRSNREIWYTFYLNKLNQRSLPARQSHHDNTTGGGTIRKPVLPSKA